MHYAGTSLGGIPGNVDGYGVLVPDIANVDWDSVDDLRATIERVGPERVAAFFCEPVVGAGGVYPPPRTTSRRAQALRRATTCCSSPTR